MFVFYKALAAFINSLMAYAREAQKCRHILPVQFNF